MADDSPRSTPPAPEKPTPPQWRRATADRRTTVDAKAGGGDALTTNSPNGRPESEGANADTADDSGTSIVIVQPQDFRLPKVLSHIEAGRIVVLIPQDDYPD